LIDLMCQPGFSTRTETTDISGRGVGLDAVRSAVTELGGTIAATSEDGVGTTWTVSLPVPRLGVHGHVMRIAGVPFPVMIESTWQPTAGQEGDRRIDLAQVLDLPGGGAGDPIWFQRGDDRVGLLCETSPTAALARRLVTTTVRSLGEVVVLDSVEAMLVRPERL